MAEQVKKKCTVAGRNASKPTTKRYWATHRYQTRREARIKRHILAHPNDLTAPAHLRRVEEEPLRHILQADEQRLPQRPAKAGR